MDTLHFDARFIRLDRHDGISRFSAELVKALSEKVKVVCLIHDLGQLDSLPKDIEYVMVNHPESPAEFFIAGKLNKIGATRVFSPMQLMGSFGRKYKLILTLHDLIYYRHRKPPQDLNLLIRVLWRLYHLSYQPQRWLLNRADAVATVSETTKTLIQKHHLTTRPVAVIYNAPDKLGPNAKRSMPSARRLLYIGSFMPYKNVETLVRAVGMLPGFELHLLSKITPARKSQLQAVAVDSKANVIFHNGVSDDQYRDLLTDAFALVSASKDEGFGIPLVEAMQVGTPVVVSDLDIFREVAGSAGVFFASDNSEDLANKLREMESDSLWLKKSSIGISQAQRFDWAKSAQALLDQFANLDS